MPGQWKNNPFKNVFVKKIIRFSIAILLVVFIIAQFFRPDWNTLPSHNKEADFLVVTNPPEAIAKKIVVSCYDCHSTQPNLPWYSHISPVSWLIYSHVEEGLDELNFSSWNQYTKFKKIKYLDEMCEEISEDKMPLPIHTLVHHEAKFGEEEKAAICEWFEATAMHILKEKKDTIPNN